MTLPIVPNGYDAPLFAVWTSGNRSLVSYKKFFSPSTENYNLCNNSYSQGKYRSSEMNGSSRL